MASMKRLTALFACLLLLVVAPTAAARTIEVGQPEPFPAASCPENCQAIAQVSGYNAEIGKSKNTYRINRPGRVVALTLRLGEPNADQLNYFRTTFGGVSQARVSILKPAKTQQRHRLIAQSELFNLEPYFGTTPTFALRRSLAVPKGHIIALTVPTWAPAFAHGLGHVGDPASRGPDERGQPADLRLPLPHGAAALQRRLRARSGPQGRVAAPPLARYHRASVHGGLDFHGRLPRFRRRPAGRLAGLVLPPP
jgi:hypothetical protein